MLVLGRPESSAAPESRPPRETPCGIEGKTVRSVTAVPHSRRSPATTVTPISKAPSCSTWVGKAFFNSRNRSIRSFKLSFETPGMNNPHALHFGCWPSFSRRLEELLHVHHHPLQLLQQPLPNLSAPLLRGVLIGPLVTWISVLSDGPTMFLR